MPYFKFDYKNNLEISTYFTQEMLKKGFLAGNLATMSISHKNDIIKKYNNSQIFKKQKTKAEEAHARNQNTKHQKKTNRMLTNRTNKATHSLKL